MNAYKVKYKLNAYKVNYKFILGIAVALAGCASGLPTDQTLPIEKQYTTDSNIPRVIL